MRHGRRFVAAIFLFSSACAMVKGGGTKSAESSEVQANSGFKCNTEAKMATDPKEHPYGPTCQELVSAHPILDKKDPPENKKIICPFLRMVQRTGLLDESAEKNLAKKEFPEAEVPITIADLEEVAQKFGLVVEASAFGSPAGVAAGQQGRKQADITNDDVVDIGRLPFSKGIAHNCGFNFFYDADRVSDEARDRSLASIKAKAHNGRVLFSDLQKTKMENCARDYAIYQKDTSKKPLNPIDAANNTFGLTQTDQFELALLFMYLGGPERGYILYDDIDRFFHGKMPANKTKYTVTPQLALLMRQSIGKYRPN